MTDPFDELMELQPTHASALLIDPIDLAERAGRSARSARRRANMRTGLTAVAAVVVVGALGAMFLRPSAAIPGGSPSPVGVPGFGVEVQGGFDPAPYTTERATVELIVGKATPDQICLGDFTDQGICTKSVPVTGLTWAMIPWRESTGSTFWARAFLRGVYDGHVFAARIVGQINDYSLTTPGHSASPSPTRTKLLTCEVTVNSSLKGLSNVPLSFPGLDAFWADADSQEYMVATSGDLGVAVTAVKKAVEGNVCIGTTPTSGPLADLIAAVKRVNAAGISEVLSASVAEYPGGVMQVNVTANVPGLREKVVEVAGAAIPLLIEPYFLTVK